MRTRIPGKPGLLLMFLCLAACDRTPPQPEAQWVPVRVETAGSAAESGAVRYSAVVTPGTQVNLAFKASGYVESILQHPAPGGGEHPVTQGEPVSKDQVMATLNDESYRDKVESAEADLASARANLVKAEADFRRASALYKTQSMTGTDYDSAQQQYSSARANVAAASARLDDARLDLSYCRLKSPMDAVVLKRNIEVGTLVAPDTTAFVVADLAEVKVLFAVPDVMLKNLAVGDSLAITTRSLPGKTFEGIITSLSPVADSQTRVFNVELTLPNPDGRLKDGMVAALSVPDALQAEAPSLSVPIAAIVGSRGNPQGYALYVVSRDGDGTVARLREVKLGKVRGNRVVVLEGLEAGTRVVTSGVNTVRDGGAVRILH
ncbi:MAG TPA: efflux RND transporter periplasmic adaptor subunit [Gammaproteobacteria bacterium]|nr:efflux RND transporter periplasmic adaptor subunit [Gammaproteobacteria bacterium]